jgi:hypothetical protein
MYSITELREELVSVCEKAKVDLSEQDNLAIKTPYIPYIPDPWNGCLVLCEAQNLSDTNKDFRQKYIDAENKDNFPELIRRLYPSKNFGVEVDNLGIGPWDDGRVKVALACAFDIDWKKTGVSNAVLWSAYSKKRNYTPNSVMLKKSIPIWKAMLDILQQNGLTRVITCGSVARNLIDNLPQLTSIEITRLCFPAMRVIKNRKRQPGIIIESKDIILNKYEIIKRKLESPVWGENTIKELNKSEIKDIAVVYACYAIQKAKESQK